MESTKQFQVEITDLKNIINAMQQEKRNAGSDQLNDVLQKVKI